MIGATPFFIAGVTLALASLGAGCQEGCARDWVAGKAAVVAGPVPATSGSPRFGVDCPSGLARCRGGQVESSLLHSYRVPCSSAPEECRCPWVHESDCPNGCVAEGFEWPLEPAEVTQLCAPSRTSDLARPLARATPPETPEGPLCDDDRFACVGGHVFQCDGLGGGERAHAIAACVAGCFHEGAAIDTPEWQAATAVAFLCKH